MHRDVLAPMKDGEPQASGCGTHLVRVSVRLRGMLRQQGRACEGRVVGE